MTVRKKMKNAYLHSHRPKKNEVGRSVIVFLSLLFCVLIGLLFIAFYQNNSSGDNKSYIRHNVDSSLISDDAALYMNERGQPSVKKESIKVEALPAESMAHPPQGKVPDYTQKDRDYLNSLLNDR